MLEIPSPYFLRITATSDCNLRCEYCNPDGEHASGLMSDRDLIETMGAANELGIKTIHWTGGEPTKRKGIVGLVMEAKNIGIETQSITTNGVLFNRMAIDFRNAGLTGASISLDSLDPVKVKTITGFDVLKPVRQSIVQSCDLFPNVVVNMVVMRQNLNEIPDFVEFAKDMQGKFIPRFCELQNFGPRIEKNPDYFGQNYVSRTEIVQALTKIEPLEPVLRKKIDKENGHAEYFRLKNQNLVVGIIAPYFYGWQCARQNCGRIRIGPTGVIKSCVFSPSYQLSGLSYDEKLNIIQMVIGEKNQRRKENNFPPNHVPAYKQLRFGL